jgi:hypothetical protein
LVLCSLELLPTSVEFEVLFSSVVLTVEGGGVTTVIGAGAGCTEVVVVVAVSWTRSVDEHPLTNGMTAMPSADSAIQRDNLFISLPPRLCSRKITTY